MSTWNFTHPESNIVTLFKAYDMEIPEEPPMDLVIKQLAHIIYDNMPAKGTVIPLSEAPCFGATYLLAELTTKTIANPTGWKLEYF